MKILQVLGHNFKWNIDAYNENSIGDGFLISAFTFGDSYLADKRIMEVFDDCMIDLQFYGKKSPINKGHLRDFNFHPINNDSEEITSLYLSSCITNSIRYQEDKGFEKIIIPISYETENCKDVLGLIKQANLYLSKNRKRGIKYYMTLPFSYDIIRSNDSVDEILAAVTDMNIIFDGFFIVCETKPEQGHKITVDAKIITNLSKVFKTLKYQEFETIYGYANWDALIYLSQTNIDYITIGTFENLRNFFIKRYTQDMSGGASQGYYFSEKLLNFVKAQDLSNIRQNRMLNVIANEKNIFSDVILKREYVWSTQKPEVNKNYLLAISRLLNEIESIDDIRERTLAMLYKIQEAIDAYNKLDDNYVALAASESQNYHLLVWQQYLLKTIAMRPSEFMAHYRLSH